MRSLRRKNKRKRYRQLYTQENAFSNKVYYFLKDKKFGTFPNPLKTVKKKLYLEIPASFSISENPDESIRLLKKLFFYGSCLSTKEIEIDHTHCVNLEIAASTIMDVIVLSIKEFHRKSKHEITFSGIMPTSGRVKDIFIASGLGAHLKLTFPSNITIDRDKMKLFKLQSGYYHSGRSGPTATKLTEYIKDCIETQDYSLTDTGRNLLLSLFGEVIDNCELHAGSDSTWFALGHYQIQPGNTYGEIQLVIFNFGNTIYEKMIGENTSDETKAKLAHIKSVHEKFFSSHWNEEMLITLFSLQEGISRLRDQNVEGNKRRGTGTVRLIDSFQKIGRSCNNRDPLMTITSGRTHIKFNQKYLLHTQYLDDSIIGKGNRKIIAFNEYNNIYLPPDPENVIWLKEFFPGTIISLDFFFDKHYFEQNVKEPVYDKN